MYLISKEALEALIKFLLQSRLPSCEVQGIVGMLQKLEEVKEPPKE
jgi:hypothetical protein